MHSETVYATHIRNWLNSEWGKLGRVNPPFDAKRLPLASPNGRFSSFVFFTTSQHYQQDVHLFLIIFCQFHCLFQFHTNPMDAIVAFSFAGMPTICT